MKLAFSRGLIEPMIAFPLRRKYHIGAVYVDRGDVVDRTSRGSETIYGVGLVDS